MNHAVEYFYTLIDHKFERDKVDVSFKEGKYQVRLHLDTQSKSSLFSNFMKRRLLDCIDDYISYENIEITLIPLVITNVGSKLIHNE